MNLYEKIAYLKRLRNVEREIDQRMDSLMKEMVHLTEEALDNDPDGFAHRAEILKKELEFLEGEERSLMDVIRQIRQEADDLLEV